MGACVSIDSQVDWLPNGVCLELLQHQKDAGMVMPRLDSIETRMEKMVRAALYQAGVALYNRASFA